MSHRIKSVGLALAAVTALTAIASSTATAELAPRWKAAGIYVANGSTRHYNATLTGTATLQVPGLLTLETTECFATGQIVGSAAKAAGTGKEAVLSCLNMNVKGAPACEVQDVATNKAKGQLGWMEEKPATPNTNVATFEPEKSGGTLGTVVIEGCALEGEYPLAGGLIGTLEPPEEEREVLTLRFGTLDLTTTEHWFTSNTTFSGVRETMKSPGLSFGGKAATLTGSFDVRLIAENFGVFAG